MSKPTDQCKPWDLCLKGPARSQFLDSVPVVGAHWGGPRTPRYHGPPGCFTRKSMADHGPRRRPAMSSPPNWFFVRFFWDGCCFLVVRCFCLWGWNAVRFCALQDLTLACYNGCCPLSLSLAVSCVRRRCFFLSLSLRRWGNPNPFWGLGFPLCLFILDADSDFDPYFLLLTYTKATPSPCFFFFFFASASFVFLVWVFSFCSGAVCPVALDARRCFGSCRRGRESRPVETSPSYRPKM